MIVANVDEMGGGPGLSWNAVRSLLIGAVVVGCAVAAFAPLTIAVGLIGLTITAMLVLRYPVAGLVLLVVAVPWGSLVTIHAGSFPISPVELLVAELAVAWLGVSWLRRGEPAGWAEWTPFLLLFLVAIVLSMTQATDLKASLREVLKWAEAGLVYWVTVRFVRDRATLRLLLWTLVLSGVSEALLGYTQFLFQLGPEAFSAHRAFFRSYGTFDQPNPYAGFLNMVLPMALALWVAGPVSWRRHAMWASLLLGLALLMSQSRGGLLAALAASTVILTIVSARARAAAQAGIIAGLAASLGWAYGVLPTGPLDKVLSGVGLGGVAFGNVTNANFSSVERAAHWLAGVRMFATHPLLGVGIGNYGAAYPRYHPRGWYASLEHAHNYYINIAAEAGIVGLLTYALLAAAALWYSCAAIRQVHDRLCRATVLGVLGALTATDVHNLFDVLYVHGMAALLGLLVGLLPVCRAPASGERSERRPVRRDGWGSIGVVERDTGRHV